jgi:methionyl-tRNA synthetase
MVASTALALYPYLPNTSRSVLESLGVVDVGEPITWAKPVVEAGTSIRELPPLFSKVELDPEE